MLFSIVLIYLFIIHMWFLLGAFSSRKVIVESDYIHSYSAGKIISDGIKDVYNLDTQLAYQNRAIYPDEKNYAHPFRNPPFVAVLFIPFSRLSYFQSFLYFNIFNLFLILLLLIISFGQFKNIGKYKLSFLLPFAFSPVILCLTKGQTTILMLLVYLLVLKYFENKPGLSGFLYSLTFIKPHFFVVGLPFIVLASRDKSKLLRGIVIGSVALFLVNIYVSSVEVLIKYPVYLLTTENSSHGTLLADMFNLKIFFQNITGNEMFTYALLITTYLTTLFIFSKRHKSIGVRGSIVVVFLLIPLLSPHTYPYDLSLWLIPIMMLLDSSYSKNKDISVVNIPIAMVLLAIPNFQFLGEYWLNSLFVLTIIFSLLYVNDGDILKID
jgi:hypothetical protein